MTFLMLCVETMRGARALLCAFYRVSTRCDDTKSYISVDDYVIRMPACIAIFRDRIDERCANICTPHTQSLKYVTSRLSAPFLSLCERVGEKSFSFVPCLKLCRCATRIEVAQQKHEPAVPR